MLFRSLELVHLADGLHEVRVETFGDARLTLLDEVRMLGDLGRRIWVLGRPSADETLVGRQSGRWGEGAPDVDDFLGVVERLAHHRLLGELCVQLRHVRHECDSSGLKDLDCERAKRGRRQLPLRPLQGRQEHDALRSMSPNSSKCFSTVSAVLRPSLIRPTYSVRFWRVNDPTPPMSSR